MKLLYQTWQYNPEFKTEHQLIVLMENKRNRIMFYEHTHATAKGVRGLFVETTIHSNTGSLLSSNMVEVCPFDSRLQNRLAAKFNRLASNHPRQLVKFVVSELIPAFKKKRVI